MIMMPQDKFYMLLATVFLAGFILRPAFNILGAWLLRLRK